MILRVILFASILTITGCTSNSINNENFTEIKLKLWYIKPAKIWEEALPIGNGRLGAMVYGGTVEETIQFNEETVWAGEPGNNILPAVKDYLPEIRQLIFEGKYKEAQQLADKYLPRITKEDNNYGMCYQPVGNLQIVFPDNHDITDYYRDLDISKAVASVEYKTKGVTYRREVISSLADNIIAVEIIVKKKDINT